MIDFARRLVGLPERDFVLLRMSDGWKKSRAWWADDELWAAPYGPQTTCRLIRGGDTDGACYVREWRPITDKTIEHYHGAKLISLRAA